MAVFLVKDPVKARLAEGSKIRPIKLTLVVVMGWQYSMFAFHAPFLESLFQPHGLPYLVDNKVQRPVVSVSAVQVARPLLGILRVIKFCCPLFCLVSRMCIIDRRTLKEKSSHRGRINHKGPFHRKNKKPSYQESLVNDTASLKALEWLFSIKMIRF